MSDGRNDGQGREVPRDLASEAAGARRLVPHVSLPVPLLRHMGAAEGRAWRRSAERRRSDRLTPVSEPVVQSRTAGDRG